MFEVNDCIKAEADEVAAQLIEKVSLAAYEMRPTYWTFRVTEVDGRKPAHLVLVSYYDDQIYLPAHLRKEGDKLNVYDMGLAEKPSRCAVASWSVRIGPADGPFSLVEMLRKAHERAWRGPLFKQFDSATVRKEAMDSTREALGL